MAIGEIVAGVVGAGIGAAAALGTPWIAERVRHQGTTRTRQLEALASLREESRAAVSGVESAIKALFASSSAGTASLPTLDISGQFCTAANLAVRNIRPKDLNDLHEVVTFFNDLIREVWAQINEVSRRRTLLSPAACSRYDAEARQHLEARLALAVQVRERMKTLLRERVQRLGGSFPKGLGSPTVEVQDPVERLII